MAGFTKGLIKGGRLIGVVFQSKVSLWDFDAKSIVSEYSLYEDTDTRVALSSDGRWLVVGSWKSGLKVFSLETSESFEIPDVEGMTYLDVFSRGSKVCCGGNKKSGCQIVSLDEKEVVKSSTRYQRIIEVPERNEYVAFDFGNEQVFVLDEKFEQKWKWEWESFALGVFGFKKDKVFLSGPNGQMAIVDLETRSTKLLRESKHYSGVEAVHLGEESIYVLVSEYRRGNESAVLCLDGGLQIEEVFGKFPPSNRCEIIDGKVVRLDGGVFDLKSGEKVDQLGFGVVTV